MDLSGSLDETYAFLTREHPEKLETDELRRAIEMSLLACALRLRAESSESRASSAAQRESSDPRRVLGVAARASPDEIRSAYKRLALETHPDKGGAPGAFEKVCCAYRALTAGEESSFEDDDVLEMTCEASVARRDGDLLAHRGIVALLMSRHGADERGERAALQLTVETALGLSALECGATNVNEQGERIFNQCFYLSIAASYLGLAHQPARKHAACDEPCDDVLHTVALRVKRVVEAAVLAAHPEWAGASVGENVEAFSDFLFFVLDSPSLLSELAIAIFDVESGFVEIYKGRHYSPERTDPERRANLCTIRHLPGHYQALVKKTGPRPSLDELIAELDASGVFYVVTDG